MSRRQDGHWKSDEREKVGGDDWWGGRGEVSGSVEMAASRQAASLQAMWDMHFSGSSFCATYDSTVSTFC